MERIREEFCGRFQQMVELCADEAGEAGRGDQSFRFAGFSVGDATAGEIGAEHEIGRRAWRMRP